MDDQIRKILDELYVLSPDLRKNETELIRILGLMVQAKPVISIDQRFVQTLRSKLVQSKTAPSSNSARSWSSLFSIINPNSMKKFNLAIGATAVCAVAILVAVYYSDKPFVNNKSGYIAKVSITSAGSHAFGKLDSVSAATGKGGGGGDESLAATPTADNASSTATAPMAPNIAVGRGGGGGIGSVPMPPEEYPTYRYVYKGDPIELAEAQRTVLKRIKGQGSVSDLSGLVSQLSFNLVNLGSFGNLRLQSMNLAEPGDDGYNIYVNADESSVSINGAWPKLMYDCSANIACPGSQPVKIENIPSDEEVISIANSFLSDHGISKDLYGEPVVQNDWRIMYDRNPAGAYVPETITVVYPLQIQDQTLYDEGGNKSGLNVSINVRNKKVISVYDLAVPNFQSSQYDAETDSAKLLKIAEKGGMYGYVQPNAKKFVDIELGTPKIELVRMWNYKNNQSEELLIPSLIFPITKLPDSDPYFYRNSVTVPLIKEILDKDNGNPIITPMMEKQ